MQSLSMIFVTIFSVALPVADWHRLPSLPDREGLAAPFAGVSNEVLIVAGGANFPGKKPWEGGKKKWYDTIYALDKPDGIWKTVGKMPRPLAYGVCVSHGRGVVCVGGSDAERHYADVFRLELLNGKLVVKPLPQLPKPLANACGALVGDTLYVAGGQEKPDSQSAFNHVWKIDLSAAEPKWQVIADCPGAGRILAVAASYDGAFWLVGGAELVAGKGGTITRRYLQDAYRYDGITGWKRIADFPHPVVAAPSPALTTATGFLVFGGDDGSQVNVPPTHHRGFIKTTLHYDVKADKWQPMGEMPAPRVTVPSVIWQSRMVIPSGEMRPGIRSPEVWGLTIPK